MTRLFIRTVSKLVMAIGLVSLPSANLARAEAPQRKPNIILVFSDDLGIPAIGCYGGAYKTPHLDALAASGMRFEYCFSAPLCGPSRALTMTGRYAFRTGVKDNGLGAQATPEKDGCVALLMKQAGYATAVAGKWRQLSHFTTKEDGARWGFDEFLIWGAGTPDEEGKAARQGRAKDDRYWDPAYNLNGKRMKDTAGKYGPDLLNAFVIDFVRRHREEPFFVYYPTPLIHSPILPTPDSGERGAGKQKAKKDPGSAGGNSLYAANISYLDKLVGQLVAELDALKLRDNTLVIFTGDNGSVPVSTINGRNVQGTKHTMLEGGSRVPLIANWPAAMPKGVVSKDLIDFSDFLPTFAELGGAKGATVGSSSSASSSRTIDGRSFAPQLRGETGQPREWAYVQLGEERYVRNHGWKLTGTGELFDMSDAPFKQIPVPADSSNPQATAARTTLQATLDKLRGDEPASNDVRKRKKKKA